MPVELQYTPLLLVYLVSAIVTLWLTVYGIQQYNTGAAATETTLAFVGIVLSASVWTVSRGFELLFVSETLSRFWLSILYVGYGGATMSALFFGLAFTGRKHLLTPRNIAAVLVIPLIVVFVAATNQLHELLWVSGGFPEESGWWGTIVVHTREFQPLFYAYLAYTVTATVIGVYYLIRTAFESASIYRQQTAALVVGSVAGLSVGLLFALDQQPFVPGFVDLSPVGFAVMGLCFGYAVFRHQFLDLVPVARDTVIEGMRDGYIVLDTDDRVVGLNATARQMFAADESVIGNPVSHAFPSCADAVETHEHGTPTETDIEYHDNGGRRFFTVRVSSLHEGQTLVGRLLLLQDVTERKQREEELRQMNSQLEAFARIVSHDLRSPLTVAHGHLDLAQRTGDEEHFEKVETALFRMDEIIEDMLELTQQESTVETTTAVELDAVAREAWTYVDTGDAELTIDDSITVRANRSRLLQLFENLFRNAIEHATSESEDALTVAVGYDDALYVADNGVGIPPEERRQILEPGYTTSRTGTGLGLSIVKRVADAHGWNLRVTESNSGGARFVFSGVTVADSPTAT